MSSLEYRSALDYERSADRAGAFRLGGVGLLPFKVVEPIVVLVEFLVVMLASLLSGIWYHLVFFGSVGNIETFVSVGLLVCVNVSAISAARGDYRPNSLLNFS